MVTGNVKGSVQAAGGVVSVRGSVGQSVRVFGGNVTIEGDIAGDVLAFGGVVHVLKGARIGGDIVSAGGDVVIDGTVAGDLLGGGGTFVLGGTVQGNADIRGKNVELSGTVKGKAVLAADELQVDPGARINGDLRYWTKAGEMDLKGVVGGTVKFDETLKLDYGKVQRGHVAGAAAAFFGGFLLYSILSAALMILLLMLLTRTIFPSSAQHLKTAPWYSLLYGFLYFIAVPVVAILAAVTIIGIPVALIVAALYAVSILLAKPLTALIFAHWLRLRSNKKWAGWQMFLAAVGLFVVLKLLILIPILGWLICLIAICMAFGALLMTKKEKYLMVR
jgi:cytoskeletal protein CcmA (bactofilin family)